jgi:hypothetical protein
MNKEDEDRQIRETRSLLQKAGQRNASLETVSYYDLSLLLARSLSYTFGLQRRDALRRLISLTHTPSAELKVFAAQNFSHYFKDFPDLEEDVIDSVYDICEDPDVQVNLRLVHVFCAYSTFGSLGADSGLSGHRGIVHRGQKMDQTKYRCSRAASAEWYASFSLQTRTRV